MQAPLIVDPLAQVLDAIATYKLEEPVRAALETRRRGMYTGSTVDALLSIDRTTRYRWIERGILPRPVIVEGKRHLFARHQIDAILEGASPEPAVEKPPEAELAPTPEPTPAPKRRRGRPRKTLPS